MKKIYNILTKIEAISLNTLKALGLILAYLFWILIFILILKILNINTKDLTENQKNIITLISNISFLIFIIIIYYKKLYNDFKNYFNKKIKENLSLSIKYWMIGLIIMFLSNIIISILTGGKIANNEQEIRNLIELSPILMIFEVGIYAPITEELIFRHSIKQITNNKYIYPLLSGLIFGGLHVIPTMTNPIDLLFLIPYSSLGVAFACLYQKTNNIFSSITVHSIHNTMAFLLLIVTL